MLLNRSYTLLLLPIFGFTWVQATPAQHPWVEAQSNPISITEALLSKVSPLPMILIDEPDFQNEQGNPQRFNIHIGRNYVLPFIVSTIYNADRFTLEEKATIMEFIVPSIQNNLSGLKIESDDLEYLLHTLIVKGDVTTLQRLSMMTKQNQQTRFVALLTVLKVHQSNIAAVHDLLKSYQTIDVWRTSLQKTEMTKVLVTLHETVSSISNSNKSLWREFYMILNM